MSACAIPCPIWWDPRLPTAWHPCSGRIAPEFFNEEHGSGPALGGFEQDGAAEPAGGWCWLSGDPWSYSNWKPGEPNNGRAREGTEDRLMVYSGIPRRPAATISSWCGFQQS